VRRGRQWVPEIYDYINEVSRDDLYDLLYLFDCDDSAADLKSWPGGTPMPARSF
jgi:hypothetical protein